VLLVGATLAAAIFVVPVSSARRATTTPSKTVIVQVVINDKGIKLFKWVALSGGPSSNLQEMPGPVPRGDYVSFTIFNRGHRRHEFSVFGKKTRPIAPGGKAHLFSVALSRGSFAYESPLDRGKAFRGFLTVV
jgi:hypothetical protein